MFPRKAELPIEVAIKFDAGTQNLFIEYHLLISSIQTVYRPVINYLTAPCPI
uniref:Uncharacterized protein n=1 Tax=Octopus bimaculoides TaxID=37653 RepID=A0A0L8GTL2_OCTBM